MVSSVLTAAAAALALMPAAAPHTGYPATCARQSGASFSRAFASRDNLVAGPLAMVGARRATPADTVAEFGGMKFPLLVRPRHTVTVRIWGLAPGKASLFYASGGGVLTERRVRDGHRAITFRPCGPRRAQSDVDGDPVTFWSGFVLVSEPMCVPLRIAVDDRRPRSRHISLGRSCP
jgi:hypothetical protein